MYYFFLKFLSGPFFFIKVGGGESWSISLGISWILNLKRKEGFSSDVSTQEEEPTSKNQNGNSEFLFRTRENQERELELLLFFFNISNYIIHTYTHTREHTRTYTREHTHAHTLRNIHIQTHTRFSFIFLQYIFNVCISHSRRSKMPIPLVIVP